MWTLFTPFTMLLEHCIANLVLDAARREPGTGSLPDKS